MAPTLAVLGLLIFITLAKKFKRPLDNMRKLPQRDDEKREKGIKVCFKLWKSQLKVEKT